MVSAWVWFILLLAVAFFNLSVGFEGYVLNIIVGTLMLIWAFLGPYKRLIRGSDGTKEV